MVKSVLLMLVLFMTLLARNPAPYSELGDDIYDSLDKYVRLAKNLPQMKGVVNGYIHSAKIIKKLGFKAETSKNLSADYLMSLRELDKKRDLILTKLNALLYRSMDLEDRKTFKKVIHSGLIEFDKVSDDVIPFYKINFVKGSIKEIDTILKNEKRYKSDARKTNKEYLRLLEKKRIHRMREASKKADISREAKLNSEIELQRKKINNMMEHELIH